MQQGDQALAIGMQKTEIAGASKSFGQDVLQNHPEEFRAGQRPTFGLSRFGVDETKRDLTILASDDVLFVDDAPI